MVMKLGVPVKGKLRVSVGEPGIADFQVLPPDEIYIQGKKSGVTNMIIWQEDELVAIYDIEVSYDVSVLKQKMNQLLPDEKDLMIAATKDSITLMGKISNSSNLNQALVLAESFAPEDKVKMAEMTRAVGKDMGLDSLWENAGEFALFNVSGLITPNLITPAGISGATLSPAINTLFRFGSGSSSWSAFINSLQEDGFAKVLAEPNLISLSGQTASFLAGGEFPIPVPSQDGISIVYKDYGVGLSFTPTVLSEDRISIKVSSRVSELDFSTAIQYSGYVVPGLTTRRAATTIELADGQSFAIAGLLSENIRENVKKFPFLGDIPILGTLFKSTSFQKNETELLIIVTPRFVKPLDKNNQPLPTDYYEEPDDSEIYFNLKKLSSKKEAQEMNQSEIDGQFGHSFETD
jgi:pilus assembly protein CpaC